MARPSPCGLLRPYRDHEARLEWVFEHEDLWRRIARDPLDNLEWAGPGAAAMLAHLAWYLDVVSAHPKRSSLSPSDAALVRVRMSDMRLALGHGAPTSSKPILAAIEAHRAAWLAFVAVPGPEAIGFDAWWAVKAKVDETADALLETPCGDRQGAEALVAHVQWYAGELAAADEDLADGLDYVECRLQARRADLSLLLRD